MSVAAVIRGVKPKGAAKWLETELDCSTRQSWRIIQTGKAPSYLRAKLIRVLETAIARNKAHLDRLEDELRAIRYKETLARAEARRAQAAGANTPLAARQGERSEDALPVTGGEG